MRKPKKLPNKFYDTKPLIALYRSIDLYDHPFRTKYDSYDGRPGQRMEEKEYNLSIEQMLCKPSVIKYDFLI
ncbi:hypothetical protein OCHUTO_1055 [Orientia chuto str. Dubai]|uniref:Uncharacterized protein n=1 Tax=Orientia chuto str. Dubai TaxID=1359168 RepID=A0A0F3MJP9_9RICK|nr:hypothetical protein [Candidatus Orientia mediorientalis]KJV54814.1 hypothetical protein OCHUTO_1055 [Orientia chuto str. Dubai]